MRPLTDELTPEERKMLTDVQEHGVHVLHVMEDDEGPGYSFSIGLHHQFGQPEVIVFGLPDDVAHELLNLVADEASEGRRFVAGSEHRDLLASYPVRFLAVPEHMHATFLGSALWAYDGEPFEVVQLVWPDKHGRWPWDAGVRSGFRELQPLLDRRASDDRQDGAPAGDAAP